MSEIKATNLVNIFVSHRGVPYDGSLLTHSTDSADDVECQRMKHDSTHWTLKILNILDFEFDVCRVAGAENENLEANSTLELGSKVNFPYLGGNGMEASNKIQSQMSTILV